MKRKLDPHPRPSRILRDDGADFDDWREEVGLQLTETYGSLGHFMETREMATEEPPTKTSITALLPTATAAQVNAALEKAHDRYLKQLEDRKRDLNKINGVLLSRISDRTRDAVKAHKDYTTAINTADPVTMLQIIERVSTLSASAMSDNQTIWKARNKLSATVMDESETIDHFAKRYKTIVLACSQKL
jgi:hypothetical protein